MSLEQTLLGAECVIPRSHGHSGERSNNFTKGPITWVVWEQFGTIQTHVAMPAHSKEASIEKTTLSATQFADEPLAADDDSMGETILIAEAFGVIAVCHEANQGSGEAFQAISSVVRRIGAGTLVSIDDDERSRLVDGNGGKIPAYRKVGMKILDTATAFAGNGLSVTDSQGGFWAYGRREIEAIRVSGEGMGADPEVLVQVSGRRLQTTEVPIQVRYGIKGTSSENPISQGAGVLVNIVRLISLRRPLVFFGIPGVFLTFAGISAEIYTFLEICRSGQSHYIVFTGGFSMLIFGLLAAVEMILYSLVQILEQGKGAAVGRSGGVAE